MEENYMTKTKVNSVQNPKASALKIFDYSLDTWSLLLSLFSTSNCLISSLYLPSGERILGPMSGGVFGKYLVNSANFEDDGICHLYESENVQKACNSQNFEDLKFHNSIVVKLLPIQIDEGVVGVIVYGWNFDNFPDPDKCNLVARALGMGEMNFWLVATNQAPTSHQMLSGFETMLKLNCSELMHS